MLVDGIEKLELDAWDNENNAKYDNGEANQESRYNKELFKTCCEEPSFLFLQYHFEGIGKECYKKLERHSHVHNSTKRPGNDTRTNTCIAECIAKKLDLINDGGFASKIKIHKLLTKAFSNVDWFLNEFNIHGWGCIDQKQGNQTDCNTVPIKAAYCLWRQIQLRCPMDRIKDQIKCRKIKRKISKIDALTEKEEKETEPRD
uniref:Odorant binding protein 28 n=1 Tax=Holotrichia oblita TaxID=644536 RepID=A0A3S8UUT2_HOLOL|nr:odorant binding protein 28 [Holotrichia oblita]